MWSDREEASVQLERSKKGQLAFLAVGKRRGQTSQTVTTAHRRGWER